MGVDSFPLFDFRPLYNELRWVTLGARGRRGGVIIVHPPPTRRRGGQTESEGALEVTIEE